MQAIGFLIFLVVGVLQVAATYAGLHEWIGLHWLLAGFVALLLGWSPLVGTAIGICGAIFAWRWPVWQAVALMGFPAILGLIFAAAAGTLGAWQERRRRAA